MENINLKFLIIFVLFLLLFFLGIFKIQANNNVNISNFIIYTPYLIDTPDYSEIENLTEIYTNEYYIKANKIKIDKKNKMIFLYNNIFIKNLRRLDEFLSDDVVIYYTENGINKIIAKKGRGYLEKYQDSAINLEDKLFFTYKELYLENNYYKIIDAKISTCDLCSYDDFSCKHYEIKSEKIEVYPEDKMILYKDKIYFYNKQIFGYKKLVIPLKKKRKTGFMQETDTSVFPKVGYNNIDGFFATKDFDYYFNKNNYGKILTKYGQNTGLYYGINNNSNFNFKSININMRNYFFFNNNNDLNTSYRNINNNLNFNWQLNNKLIKYFNFYINYVSNQSNFRNFRTPLNENISYGFNTNILDTNITYNNNTSSTSGLFKGISQNINLNHSSKNINFTLSYQNVENNYISNTTLNENFKLNLNCNFFNNLYTLSLLIDNTRNNNVFFGVNKIPELTLKLNKPIYYKGFSLFRDIYLTPSIFFGKYNEPQFNRITTKYQFYLNYNLFHIKKEDINWVTTGYFKQNFYNTGNYYFDRNNHANYVNSFNSNFSLNKKYLNLNINYSYLFGKGFAPIFADFTGKYQNLNFNIKLFKLNVYEFYLSSNYNLNIGRISPVNLTFKYTNSRTYLLVNTSYDFNNHQFSNISTSFSYLIRKDLQLNLWFNYNTFNKKIDYIDVVLIKDNHCWGTYLVYRSTLKQLYVYAYLKAIPIIGINIGIDQSKPFNPVINNP
ncbi:MAG: hypothetical protein ACP5O4_03110 [bacterium]